MADRLLWRRLTKTDFDAMNGLAAPSGTGGGVMHIALGKDTKALPIKDFLGTKADAITISTEPSSVGHPKVSLQLDGNPARRDGEWRIADQFGHRHPAWTSKAGFPATYNSADRPIIFLRNRNGKYYAALSNEVSLRSSLPDLAKIIDASKTRHTGILEFDPVWSSLTGGGSETLIAYEALAHSASAETLSAFNPSDVEDGRKKIVSEVVRRQGQSSFRKKLLTAYNNKCAISGCQIVVLLEAAHITPYRGPKTNHPTNGILLKADLHTLFDLGYITIDSTSFKICVSRILKGSEYWALNGQKIKLPKDETMHPSSAALAEHNKTFVPN